jgi:hypothetical protein
MALPHEEALLKRVLAEKLTPNYDLGYVLGVLIPERPEPFS